MLKIEDIPSCNSKWEDLIKFAYSFNAMKCWSSFEKVVEVAEKVRSEDSNSYDKFSIDELRTFLYFTQRSHRHMNSVPDEKEMERIHILIETLRLKI